MNNIFYAANIRQDCQDCGKPTAGRIDSKPICYPCLERRQRITVRMQTSGLDYRIWAHARAVVLFGRVDLVPKLQELIRFAPKELKRKWQRLLADPAKVKERWNKLK